MKVHALHHLTGGRSEYEPCEELVGLFVTPEAALVRVRQDWPEAPARWPDGWMLEERAFVDHSDEAAPCGGSWWLLAELEVLK